MYKTFLTTTVNNIRNNYEQIQDICKWIIYCKVLSCVCYYATIRWQHTKELNKERGRITDIHQNQ